MTTKVTFVLPVKNERHNVRDVLESIAAQTYSNHETIVVDNGSTDDTADIATSYDCNVLDSPGKLSDARRAGVAAATGNALFFIDADQVLEPSTLEKCVAALNSPGVSAVVVPERAFRPFNTFQKIISHERWLSERAGRGVPRVFRYDRYIEIGAHEANVLFGEDAAVKYKLRPSEIAIARDTVIYHKELQTLLVLLTKYFKYGQSFRGNADVGPVTTDKAGAFLRVIAWDLLRHPRYAASVLAIKILKMLAIYSGRWSALKKGSSR